MRNQIVYKKWTFTDDAVKSGGCYLEQSLPSTALGYDTMEATVRCPDKSILDYNKNDRMVWLYRGRQMKIFCMESIARVGPQLYTLSGISAVGRLNTMPHPGGIYTGQAAEEVILDICGDVPVMVKTSLRKIPLYGWLPYCNPSEKSARDNLIQVLFAIGAALRTDLNGVLRVEPLWDGISAVVNKDIICEGGSVTYDTPVSSVAVTEHQYIPGGEEETLFEGTAEAGTLIIFDEPHSGLSATGFTIQASGANWARLTAGSGTLTGLAYIHTTRMLTVPVAAGAAENVKSITDCTLVSLVNSKAAAYRMAAYYACTEHIQESVLTATPQAGQRISVYNPYDKIMVDGVVQSADVALSSVLQAAETLLVGYVPPQVEETEYIDEMEIISTSGTWTVPDGVHNVRYVLIGGGTGGAPGSDGEPGKSGSGATTSAGGTGGPGGAGGDGGKIIQGTMDVVPGQVLPVSIGSGGLPGEDGGSTAFGQLSSAEGSASPNGFTELTTGNVYATPGAPGIDGGAGSGGGSDGPTVTYGGVDYHPGESASVRSDGTSTVAGGAGGGAAAGANGGDGSRGNIYSTQIFGGGGGMGASAASGISATVPGSGGGGGNGGGGGGGGGGATSSGDVLVFTGSGGSGGNGGAGGRGAAGLIILYYSTPQNAASGQLVTSDKKFFFDRVGRIFVM